MPRVPNADQAIIDPRKITDYLLSQTHPDGAPKAAFFESFGFTLIDWPMLGDAFSNTCAITT
jgi:hypothetical protein